MLVDRVADKVANMAAGMVVDNVDNEKFLNYLAIFEILLRKFLN